MLPLQEGKFTVSLKKGDICTLCNLSLERKCIFAHHKLLNQLYRFPEGTTVSLLTPHLMSVKKTTDRAISEDWISTWTLHRKE